MADARTSDAPAVEVPAPAALLSAWSGELSLSVASSGRAAVAATLLTTAPHAGRAVSDVRVESAGASFARAVAFGSDVATLTVGWRVAVAGLTVDVVAPASDGCAFALCAPTCAGVGGVDGPAERVGGAAGGGVVVVDRVVGSLCPLG
jgi:hypothetical protein